MLIKPEFLTIGRMTSPESVGRSVVNLAGETIHESALDHLKKGLRGALLRPGDTEYDPARKIFNAMIDKHPGLIVKCSGVADVIRCVDFARENNLLVAVRGGGHNVAGNALCDGGMVIDFSNMKSVWVDPKARTARVEPGVTLGEFLHETQVHGLATSYGVFTPTGIAGLTLGGGFGWLSGKYGLACDNLLSADVVTADGRLLTASSTENSDLFWALRGGGGNFGVVTSFEFRLHPVSDVLGGIIAWPRSRAKELLRFFREFTADKPDELGIAVGTANLPQGPAIITPICYFGPEEEGERVLGPLRRFGPPMADGVRKMKFDEALSMLDASLPPGLHNYWRSSYFRDLSDDMIDTILSKIADAPSPLSRFFIEVLSGEATRKRPGDTAFPVRSKMYNFLFLGIWQDPGATTENMDWVHASWESIRPFLSSHVYVNYLSQEGQERVRAAYGENYERLVAVKRKYDPTNLFRVNQNIKPS